MSPPNLQWMTEFTQIPWEHNFHTHPAESPLECVIVEPRKHPWLGGVLRNFSCMFPNAKITIVYDAKHNEWIDELIDHSTAIRKFGLPLKKDFDISQYCALLTSPTFWNTFKSSDRVLIFQSDTGVRKNNILRYWEYDYVGAAWGGEVKHLDPWIRVGNGGLSLRNPNTCLEVIRTFPYHEQKIVEEDLYFCQHVANMDDAVVWCPVDVASSFSVEHVDHPDPLGFHQTYRYKPDEYLKILRQTDPIRPVRKLRNIEDAWVESKTGQVQSISLANGIKLKEWLGVGIGTLGLRLEEGTVIPFTDVSPGIAKKMHITWRDNEDHLHTEVLPLARKRVITQFVVGRPDTF